MNNNENIIKPFVFYPTEKKTVPLDKQFNLELDQNTNTWIMEGNGIRLINIPNDIVIITYLREYVCNFNLYGDRSIRTNLYNNGQTIQASPSRIFAYLYGMASINENTNRLALFKVLPTYENGICVVDVSPSNIIISSNKEYLLDNNFTYIKIINTNYYAKVNNEIRDYLLDECTNLVYNEKKGIRATERLRNNSSNTIANIVYVFFNGFYDRKVGVKLLDYSIKHHPELNIDFMDYTISNMYSGATFRTDDKYAYIFMPRYGIEAFMDKDIYERHKDEIQSQSWYIDSSNHVSTNIIHGIQGYGLHRMIFQLLLNDYQIDLLMTKDIQIHHINCNPFDNSLENLYVCGLNRHRSIHNYISNPWNTDEINFENVKKLNLKSNIIEVLTLGYIPDEYKKTIKLS